MAKFPTLETSIPQVSSTQEILECFIEDKLASWDDSTRRRAKLIFPAAFWLSYPLITLTWVIMLAWLQSRVLALFKKRKAKKKRNLLGDDDLGSTVQSSAQADSKDDDSS